MHNSIRVRAAQITIGLRAVLPSRLAIFRGSSKCQSRRPQKHHHPLSSPSTQHIGEATTPQPSPCLPELQRPASTAVTSPPERVVSASTASTPVVVVWLVVSTTTAPTWTSTTLVTSVRLVCGTSTSSRTTSGSPSSTSTSCGHSSPPRPVTPTSPARRRTPSPSSTSCPWATPSCSARAAFPKSPWLSARDGSASSLSRRSRRLVVSSSWLRKWHLKKNQHAGVCWSKACGFGTGHFFSKVENRNPFAFQPQMYTETKWSSFFGEQEGIGLVGYEHCIRDSLTEFVNE